MELEVTVTESHVLWNCTEPGDHVVADHRVGHGAPDDHGSGHRVPAHVTC